MNTKWNKWVRRTKDISVIITCSSIIIGILVTLIEMRSSWKQTRFTGLTQAKEIFAVEEDIQRETNIFVNISSVPDAKKIKELFTVYRTGQNVYYSKDLARFYKIAHHYEKVGALVKTGYLDFNLYYEVFAFPDKFWDKSKDLRYAIKYNWNADGKLPDFLCNIEYLHNRFKNKRNSVFTKMKNTI